MKRISIFVLALVIASAGFASAMGQDEGTTGQPRAPYFDSEEITLTGSVQLEEGAFMPELKTEDGTTYTLMLPRYYTYDSEVKEGDTITVEGFTVPSPRWETDDDKTNIAVTKAVIDGKEFEIPHRPFDAPMGPKGRGSKGRGGYQEYGYGQKAPDYGQRGNFQQRQMPHRRW